ncbi:MAG: ribonuclease [Tissierellia bacterium]|nr:ribonuclease [Tissierellia bacterium]
MLRYFNKIFNKRLLVLFLAFVFTFSLVGCDIDNNTVNDENYIDPEGEYFTVEDVALYIHLYGNLPHNYITKNDARKLGWEPSKGNLWDVTDKKIIGGDVFGNREGLLPHKEGRKYFECDVNYKGGKRGAERIVYSNDGLIYYTKDHYKSFELLYGEE